MRSVSGGKWGIIVFAFPALLAVAGCSISASIESSSKVVSSPIESSSKSSESSLKSSEGRYRDDVRDYTASYVRSGGEVEAFRAQLAELARRRGIADWEASNATWEGVGQGLARADATGAAFETYLIKLTGSDAAKMATVRAAYEQAKK